MSGISQKLLDSANQEGVLLKRLVHCAQLEASALPHQPPYGEALEPLN